MKLPAPNTLHFIGSTYQITTIEFDENGDTHYTYMTKQLNIGIVLDYTAKSKRWRATV